MLISELKFQDNNSTEWPLRVDVYERATETRYAIFTLSSKLDTYQVYSWYLSQPSTGDGSYWTDHGELDLLTLACLITNVEPACPILEWIDIADALKYKCLTKLS
jgi:hypothetical protein